MKTSKILFGILIFVLLIQNVLADGMIYIPHQPPLPEKQQLAAINYEKGLEKMILTIATDEIHAENAAWIFPVPSDPNQVVIDIITKFPSLTGKDVIQDAKYKIDKVIKNLLFTQLYPLIFSTRIYYTTGFDEAIEEKAAAGYREYVTVYESIEKEGLTTQIVGAKTGLGLYNYFRNQNIYVDPDSISVFDYYSGKDYTFIVSWISSKEEFEGPQHHYPFKRQVGVEVMFPTDKIYYPLLPTSVYGSLKIPATIYILDYVKPNLYESIETFADVAYYNSYKHFYKDPELEAFYGDNKAEKYTQININVPSKYFTDDLWMDLGAPPKVNYASFISNNSTLLTLILLPLLSILAGAILGFILFRNSKKFAFIGLANCLSILALIIATIFVKTKKIDINLKNKIKQAGMFVITRDIGKKITFIISFSILFIILTYIMKALLRLPL